MKKVLLILIILHANTSYAQCWETISGGGLFTLAVRSDGSLWGWGQNSFGELGDSTNVDQDFPIQIGTDYDWKTVAAGGNHSLAIKTNGTLWASGANPHGELGDSTIIFRNKFIQVGQDNDWKLISAGQSLSLAIKTNGTLWAWGQNNYGQLGVGLTPTQSLVPIQVGNSNDWKFINAGHAFGLAIKNNGSLWTWGYNINGQLGDGTNSFRHYPTPIDTLNSKWLSINGGSDHCIALKDDSTAWVTGSNAYGQLGNGGLVNDTNRLIQIGTQKWKTVSASYWSCNAVKSDGTLWSWGRNQYGQLGDGTQIDKSIPVLISSDTDWSNVNSTGNGTHVVSIKQDKFIWSWGNNGKGQVGIGNANSFFPNIINSVNCYPLSSNTISRNQCTFKFFPNPASRFIHFADLKKINQIQLVNIHGQLIREINVYNSNFMTDISNLKNGTYFIRFLGDKTIQVRKLIISH